MTRKEILSTPDYWIQKIQLDIYRSAVSFMQKHEMNRTQFAEYLGVTKGYVSQILNGDCNFSLSKLVELIIKMECVPDLEFIPLEEKIEIDIVMTERTVIDYSYISSGNNKKLNIAA